MRTKLKDFKLPEMWHVKIQANFYKVLSNWRRSKNFIMGSLSHLNQSGYITEYKPASKDITFPQFRRYVSNIIPPIEKSVIDTKLISISVYKDVMIDIDTITELKVKIAQLLNTEIENISIELGYNGSVTF